MTQSQPPGSSDAFLPAASGGLVNLVEQLGRLLGGGSRRALQVAFQRILRPDSHGAESWELLREGVLALGHDLALRRASLNEVLRSASPTTPVIGRSNDGVWVALLGAVGSKADVIVSDPLATTTRSIDRQTVHQTQLLSLLGLPDASHELSWGYVMPGLVLEEMASHGHSSPLQRLRALLRPEAADIRTIVIFALVVGILGLATPITVEALVNSVAFGGLLQPVIVLALVLMASLGLAAALKAAQAYIVELLQRRVFVRLVADLSARLPRAEINAEGDHYAPELANRFFDIVIVQKIGTKLLLGGVTVVLSAFIGLLVLSFYHPLLLAFDILLIGCVGIILFLMGRNGAQTAIKESYAKYDVMSWVQELARQPVTFKLGAGTELARDEADRLAEAYLDARGEHYRIVFRQLLGALLLQVVASTMLLGIGGWLVKVGQLTLGQLVASWLIVSVVLSSIAKIGEMVESWYDLLASLDKIGSLIDIPMERGSGGLLPRRATGVRLELRDVAFGWDGAPPLAQGLNLELRAGEVLGVLGRSGSGKSSLFEALVGRLTPSEGVIAWDGEDLRDLNLHSLRQDVALAQPTFAVTATIEENVRLGRPWVTLSEVRQALASVEMLEELRAWPDGLQTQIQTNGRPLSSGQLHRLLIARALVGNPRLLLIDGALDTSDPAMRQRILARLRADDRIVVVASHSSDLLESCDQTLNLSEQEGQQ